MFDKDLCHWNPKNLTTEIHESGQIVSQFRKDNKAGTFFHEMMELDAAKTQVENHGH